jgi:two-component sensor histidine kinase/ligand-binding sensor domain-containing protein
MLISYPLKLKLPARYLLSFLAILIVSLWGYSQNFNFDKISVKEGLRQSQVNKIYNDSRGFLWLATAGGGVSIYDGISFINYTEIDGLVGNIITDITEDNNGHMYCSSVWGGISKISGKTITEIISIDELNFVSDLESDSYGVVWVASNELYYLQNESLINLDIGLTQPFVQAPKLAAKGDYLYITFNNQLIKLDVVKKQVVFSMNYDHLLTCSYEDNLGNIWLGTKSNGVFKCNSEGSIVKKFTFPTKDLTEIIEPKINDIKGESNQIIWVATEYGVVRFDGNDPTLIRQQQGLPANDIQTICFDNQSNIWLGSFGNGLVKISKSPFTFFRGFSPLTKSDNFPLLEDKNGVLWVGNNNEGLFKFNGESVEIFNGNKGIKGNKIRAIASFNESVYVGSNKGLNKINGNNQVTAIPEFDDIYIKVLLNGRFGELYIGTIGQGVWKMTPDENLEKLTQIPVNEVHSLALDSKGKLLIGTNAGLVKEINGEYNYLTAGLNNTFIGNITTDRNGKIWVGTDKSIARLDGDKFTIFTEKNGLVSSLIYILHTDANGFLWVGSNLGLDRITLDQNSQPVKIDYYGYYEGFTGIECNSRGVYENESGELYFSTVEGITKYTPWLDAKPQVNLPVYLTDIKLFLESLKFTSFGDEKLNWFQIPSRIYLDHHENHLTFEFVALDYSKTIETQYTYKLEGFDKEWSPPTKYRFAVYSNLPPGNYVFKVKEYGNDFSSIAQIEVRINKPKPPFYRSGWFMLISTLFIFGGLYYLIEYRTYKTKQHQQHLRELVEQRTAEIKKQDEDKTIMLQEIHHRVKNNLQIIISLFRLQKHFTENVEAIELFKNSENRINAMAKIHEKLYKTTDLSRIALDEYLFELVQEIISSYETQKRIDLDFSVGKCNISIDQLTPLALIINEIVTNSIKYGFPAVELPRLQLHMHQSVLGKITLTMSDNGPGFNIIEKWEKSETMGFELIKSLTDQLNGEFFIELKNGHPQFTLTFKATN